jgi:hypothetical protein
MRRGICDEMPPFLRANLSFKTSISWIIAFDQSAMKPGLQCTSEQKKSQQRQDGDRRKTCIENATAATAAVRTVILRMLQESLMYPASLHLQCMAQKD